MWCGDVNSVWLKLLLIANNIYNFNIKKESKYFFLNHSYGKWGIPKIYLVKFSVHLKKKI